MFLNRKVNFESWFKNEFSQETILFFVSNPTLPYVENPEKLFEKYHDEMFALILEQTGKNNIGEIDYIRHNSATLPDFKKSITLVAIKIMAIKECKFIEQCYANLREGGNYSSLALDSQNQDSLDYALNFYSRRR